MKVVSQVAKFVTVMVGSTSSSAVLIVFFFDAPTRLNSTAVLAQQGGTASVYFADAGETCTAGTTLRGQNHLHGERSLYLHAKLPGIAASPPRFGMPVHGSCSPAHRTHTFISAGHLGTAPSTHPVMKRGGPCNTPSQGWCAPDQSSAAKSAFGENSFTGPAPPAAR